VGQVDGTDFELPASGFFPSDSHSTIQPFPFLTCSAASRIVSSHHLSGTITADDTGLGVRIGGTWENGPVTFYDPMGAICWSMTNPPSCSFDMRRNDVAVGDNVSVSPRAKTTVTFEHVTSPGTVEVMPLTQAGGTVPEQFEVLGNGGVSIFYDVRTTATFAGTITSCFPYPDADGDGIVDGSNPPLDETELRVLHEENGVFVDRTVSLDTTAKIICGATTSLSQLAIAHPPTAPSNDHPFEGGKLVLTRKPTGHCGRRCPLAEARTIRKRLVPSSNSSRRLTRLLGDSTCQRSYGRLGRMAASISFSTRRRPTASLPWPLPCSTLGGAGSGSRAGRSASHWMVRNGASVSD